MQFFIFKFKQKKLNKIQQSSFSSCRPRHVYAGCLVQPAPPLALEQSGPGSEQAEPGSEQAGPGSETLIFLAASSLRSSSYIFHVVSKCSGYMHQHSSFIHPHGSFIRWLIRMQYMLARKVK